MSTRDEGESFLSRWSRRKSEAAAGLPEGAPPASAPPEPAPEPKPEPKDAPEVDLSELPSIDSLGRDSDYTAFLREGVPDSLRNQALRKAWASDPAITGHKPFAEYDWDFNAPGYGALWPTDATRDVAVAMFRHLTAPRDGAQPASAPPAEDPTTEDPQTEA